MPATKKISTFQADPNNLANLIEVANEFLDQAGGDLQLEKLAAAISSWVFAVFKFWFSLEYTETCESAAKRHFHKFCGF